MTRGDTIRRRGTPRRAFTLVEMMVVITIILLVLAVALPAANSLWNNQKLSDAQNAIKGMLTTSRVAAQQPGTGKPQRALVNDASVPRDSIVTTAAGRIHDCLGQKILVLGIEKCD